MAPVCRKQGARRGDGGTVRRPRPRRARQRVRV